MRASIINNTNRAVSSSDESWGSIRDNTFVRFGLDEGYYTVANAKAVLYIKDFIAEKNRITIKGDIGINLNEQDCLSISYKEYELLTIIKPVDTGKGYKNGDTLYLEGGTPYVESSSGLIQNAAITVTTVDKNGSIIQVKMLRAGRYLTKTKKECKMVGGCGTGAVFEVDFNVLDTRSFIEKSVLKIDRETGTSILTLDSSLPAGVVEGKIAIEKWELFLTSNYAGETQINQPMDVLRDFTPFLHIPLLVRGSAAPETIYNLAASLIDKKLQEFQTKLDKLIK